MDGHGYYRAPLKGVGVQLHPWQRAATWVGFMLVALSGISWSLLHDFLVLEPDDLQHKLLVAHGAGAFVSMVLFGALMPQHIRFAWNARRNRKSGASMTALALLLLGTGYALYYADETLRDISKWIHLTLGLACLAILPLHVWLGRRTNLKRKQADLLN